MSFMMTFKAAGRRHLGDAVAHLAGADDAKQFDSPFSISLVVP
jgi:hypothetical protein